MPAAPTCAVLIREDGSVRQVVLDLSEDALSSLCGHLRCEKIAVVYLTDHLDLWVERDAEFSRRPFNPAATALAASFDPDHHPCHGPALLTGARPRTGRTVGLTDDQVRTVLAHVCADSSEGG